MDARVIPYYNKRPPRYAIGTTVIDSFAADWARTLFMPVTRDYNRKSKRRVFIIISRDRVHEYAYYLLRARVCIT